MAKNNFLKIGLLIGGALLIYVAAQASKFFNGLKITFSNIQLSGSLSSPTVLLTLTIQNPTDVSVKIDSLKGSLLYKGNKIADVENLTSEIIDANSVVYFDLRVQSTFADAVNLIQQFLSKNIGNDFTFSGTIQMNGLSIPYNGPLTW